MTDFDPMGRIREELADAVGAHKASPADPLNTTMWVAMSILQKGIRRGRHDLALRAAATLLHSAPDRLWRRLGIIAIEDIGLGDLTIVGHVTAALAGKAYRSKLRGDWQVASYLVTAMANSAKCRCADDLLFVGGTHPDYRTARRELADLPQKDLLTVVTGTAPLVTRAIALRYALGTDPRRYPTLVRQRGDTHAVFDHLSAAGAAPEVVAIAQENYRRTREPLGPLTALLMLEDGWQTAMTGDDHMPPEILVGQIPGWPYDMFTREGRVAFVHFLGTDTRTARWLATHVSPPRHLQALGDAVFFVEGSVMRNRLNWPVGVELLRMAAVECLECRSTAELLKFIRADIPVLNETRQQVCGGARRM